VLTYFNEQTSQQRDSTDCALGVAHNTLHITTTIANFSPLAPTPHWHVSKKDLERARSSSERSVSSELLLDENCTSSSFVQFPFSHSLTTHVS
jgi:hypothetical protein